MTGHEQLPDRELEKFLRKAKIVGRKDVEDQEQGRHVLMLELKRKGLHLRAIFHFADQLWNIVDYLTERGVVPVLFTIPPRKDKLKAGVWVPRYNAAIRGIAQARSVPLVDYHLALRKLPGGGLAAYVTPRSLSTIHRVSSVNSMASTGVPLIATTRPRPNRSGSNRPR